MRKEPFVNEMQPLPKQSETRPRRRKPLLVSDLGVLGMAVCLCVGLFVVQAGLVRWLFLVGMLLCGSVVSSMWGYALFPFFAPKK
jgi:hypothetical protein